MSYQINHNNSGWYYDILDARGHDIGGDWGFATEDQAIFAARDDLWKRNHQWKAA